VRSFGDKSFYSDHLPKGARGFYDHKPIPSAAGGYFKDGDPFRLAAGLQAI
jgi:hypothetical protein